MERKDYEFLLRSARFCDKVDSYVALFNLDLKEVEELKNDTMQFSDVITGGAMAHMYNENFTRQKIQNMLIALSYLAQSCKNNKNYAVNVGLDLGIEIPVVAFRPN